MCKNLFKKNVANMLVVLTMVLFILSPVKSVKAEEDKNSNSNIKVTKVIEEKKENDYGTLYWGLGISLVSLGLVFLNKKENKKEVKKESKKSIKHKEKKQAKIQSRTKK